MEHHAPAGVRQSWIPALCIVAVVFGGVAYSLRQRLNAPDPVIVAGRADYTNWCSPCHGPSGRGDGALGAKLDRNPADLTRIAAREDGTFRVEDLADFIDGRAMVAAHGDRDMPEWGPIFEASAGPDPEAAGRARERRRGLTMYLWTIQR